MTTAVVPDAVRPQDLGDLLARFRDTHPYQRLQAASADWHYIASGQGSSALLLLGGALSTGESGFRTIQRLEGRFRVISPSYPPVGRMDRVCDGLVALLDAEGWERVHVYGHSMGAGVAHALVRRYPERVDRLALSGFGLYNPRSARLAQILFTLFDLLPYGFVRGFYARRIPHLVAGAEPAEQAFWIDYFHDLVDVQHTKATLMGQFRILADLVRHAKAYRVFEAVERPGRVLILQAQDDRGFKPDEQAALRATYPGAQMCLFEAGGHWAMLTQRQAFEAALDEFLGR
jgi:pimeloyl-ACP methyl ester carboxylesterase